MRQPSISDLSFDSSTCDTAASYILTAWLLGVENTKPSFFHALMTNEYIGSVRDRQNCNVIRDISGGAVLNHVLHGRCPTLTLQK